MPLAVYLAIRNALVSQVQYFTERKAKCIPKHLNAWETKLQKADAALRWLDQQQPEVFEPVPSYELGGVR